MSYLAQYITSKPDYSLITDIEMKKLLFILCISLITVSLSAQTTLSKKNFRIYKPAPTLYLDASTHVGAVIDFGLEDIKLTQTLNKLTMTGGVFDFSQVPTVGGSAIATLESGTYASVADGDSVIINPYKSLTPLSLRINGVGKFWVDSTGNSSQAGTSRNRISYSISDDDSILINPTTALRMIDVRVGGVDKWWVDSTGNMGAAGILTPTGGIVLPNASPVIWAKGGSTVLATSGTDKACSNGARWWVEIYIPYNVTLNGIAYLVGSVGGTDSVMVHLYNSAGTLVASSKHTGATHGAIVGTAAQFQSCPFYSGGSTTTYAATAGLYYATVQFNGTTAKFRTYPIPGSKFIANTAAGTWDVAANITPGTTFVADDGPILMTY